MWVARCSSSKFSSSHEATALPDFLDGETAYEMKTSGSLIRSLFVLKLCSIDLLVNNQKKLITWGGRILTPGIFSKLVKATFYQQFVAGEDLNQVLHVRDQYRDMGIRSILDYSVEDDLSPEAIHKSMGYI
jgi:hypothetical protein